MSDNTAPERPVTAPGEINNVSVSFDGVLDLAETLTGTPAVVEVTTTDLTISSIAVSTEALRINGKNVGTGRAIQFRVQGQLTASKLYTLKITATTSASPPQTKVKYIKFLVEEE